MSVSGSMIRDEGWTCGVGHNDTDWISITNSTGRGDQLVLVSR